MCVCVCVGGGGGNTNFRILRLTFLRMSTSKYLIRQDMGKIVWYFVRDGFQIKAEPQNYFLFYA